MNLAYFIRGGLTPERLKAEWSKLRRLRKTGMSTAGRAALTLYPDDLLKECLRTLVELRVLVLQKQQQFLSRVFLRTFNPESISDMHEKKIEFGPILGGSGYVTARLENTRRGRRIAVYTSLSAQTPPATIVSTDMGEVNKRLASFIYAEAATRALYAAIQEERIQRLIYMLDSKRIQAACYSRRPIVIVHDGAVHVLTLEQDGSTICGISAWGDKIPIVAGLPQKEFVYVHAAMPSRVEDIHEASGFSTAFVDPETGLFDME